MDDTRPTSDVSTSESGQREKTISGHFEAEISHEGEAGLHSRYANCKKNPGHKKFIPIKDFSKDHLPARYRCQDMEDLVKALADITVRVINTYISADRPDTLSFYEDRGKDKLVVGSGFIYNVLKYTENEYTKCPCDECKKSKVHDVWGSLYVKTVRHVVFDQSEANFTTCQILDEGNKIIGECFKPRIIQTNTGQDMCELRMRIYDANLLDMLAQRLNTFKLLKEKTQFTYPSVPKWKLPFIEILISNLDVDVNIGGGLSNLRSVGDDDNDDDDDDDAVLAGDLRDSEYRHAEDKLEKDSKSPPVDLEELTLQHLPEDYRDMDILDFIKVQACFIVKLSVLQVSEHRPMDLRRNGRVFSGSGRVSFVSVHEDHENVFCKCEECNSSGTSEKTWAEIFIETSRDVVYDESEASCCTCEFFMGKSDSEFTFRKLETNKTFSSVYHPLSFPTHNMDLVKKLRERVYRRNELYMKIQNKFNDCRQIYRDKTDRNKLVIIVSYPHGQEKHVTVGKFVERVIKEMPHSRELFERNDKEMMRNLDFHANHIYTANTCPGSSGAPVFVYRLKNDLITYLHGSGQPGNINVSASQLQTFYK